MESPCRNAAQEEEAVSATPIPKFYQEPTGAYLPPYDRPDMLHQGRPHPPFSLPHHHRHKRVITSVIPERTNFPFTGNIIPHGTGTMAAPPQRKLKSRSIPVRALSNQESSYSPASLSSAGMSGSSEARIPQSRETRNIRSPRMIPVRMGDEKVFCFCNLLRCEIRYPVQSVRRSSRIHDKSVAPSFNKKAAASEITAAACNCYLHIHLH